MTFSRATLLLLLLPPRLLADDGVAFFEKKIRPALVEHCYGCHSAEARAKKQLRGGLLLDTKEATAAWHRIEYDVAGAAAAIRHARLPDSLAERLGYGQ